MDVQHTTEPKVDPRIQLNKNIAESMKEKVYVQITALLEHEKGKKIEFCVNAERFSYPDEYIGYVPRCVVNSLRDAQYPIHKFDENNVLITKFRKSYLVQELKEPKEKTKEDKAKENLLNTEDVEDDLINTGEVKVTPRKKVEKQTVGV